MSTVADDTRSAPGPVGASPRLAGGLVLAVVSAFSFGLAGPLARGLLDTGWSPGAAVLVRVGVAALLVTPLGIASMRGRWSLLRRNAGLVVLYGCFAVAGAQFCYFAAVQHMQVAPALLIEFTAPAAVVVFLWVRRGHRPGRLTLLGAALAAVGLVLVLDVLGGADLSTTGVLWALGAMLGATVFFIVSADEDNGLPPFGLAWGGLMVGALGLVLLGVVGALPMHASTAAPTYAGHEVTWWVPLLLMGAVTAAVPYVTGIAAGRRIGSRLASFVGLLEVVSGVVWAWLLLAQLPGPVQLVGGLLILAGVVAVKFGERSVVTEVPVG